MAEVLRFTGMIEPGRAVRLAAAGPEVHADRAQAVARQGGVRDQRVAAASRALQPVQQQHGARVRARRRREVEVHEVAIPELEALARQLHGRGPAQQPAGDGLRVRAGQPPRRPVRTRLESIALPRPVFPSFHAHPILASSALRRGNLRPRRRRRQARCSGRSR